MTQTTVAGPSTAQGPRLMPGSFNPGDYIDFHENPFENAVKAQALWESKEPSVKVPWSTDNLPDLDLEGVEWFNYAPPAALSRAPNVASEILQGLVKESIETVRAAAEEEKRRKADADAAQEEERRATTEQSSSPGQGDEPYLPIIIPVEKPVEKPLPTPPPSESEAAASEIRSSDDLSQRRAEAVKVVSRSKSPSLASIGVSSDKTKKLNLRRILGWTHEKDSGNADKTSRAAFARKLLAGSQSPHANYIFSVYQPETKSKAANTAPPDSETKPEEPIRPKPPPVETVECVSCLDDFPLSDVIKVPCHSYCHDCFESLISISVQNEQQWPPKCCLNQIPYRTVFAYVSDDLKNRFTDRKREWNLAVEDRIYCYEANCGRWIRPEALDSAEQVGRCSSGHKTCIMCRGKSHGSKPCERDTNLALTQQLAEEQGWKQCGKCKAYVEHAVACRHMTCRCGYQFCYVCGRKWCTCGCTGDQLAVIKDQAQKKAKERRVREKAEAEELRVALAQIAEFEREEALKAEMLRQEQERLERERQQRELEERVRKEAIRRADLEAKFSELRKGLDLLHDLQLVMLESHQEGAAQKLADEISEAKQLLEEKHQQERTEVETDIKQKLEVKDEAFGEDYRQRSAAEVKMIQNYKAQLEAFYTRHPRAIEEIEKALSPLLQRMEENQQAYNKWKDGELEKYQNRLRDRQQIKEEYRYSASARLQDAQDQKEMELVKRTVAENKWMQMVVLERERMLGTMEGDEMEGDADSLFAEVEGEVEGVGVAI